MSKLFIFAIGGTGTRVLNSLLMLLATGVSSKVDEIVPMIIDTDINNGDLDKFRKVVKKYRSIQEKLYSDTSTDKYDGLFFRTKVASPQELNISGLDYGTLKDMLSYSSLIAMGFSETKFLTDLLFSDKNLNISLEKGFLGNPNIGSIVLKNVLATKGFQNFTTNFRPGDRIFIISSIFGGTGAAGFPLLLNIFRDEHSSLNNINYINNSIIGAVTVMPYFEVDNEKFQAGLSAINSNTFTAKTKAALSYYHKHLGTQINALYYIGDTKRNNYENHDGGNEQINPNSFIEMAAATSIIDFINFEPTCSNSEDLPEKTTFFEFGIEHDFNTLDTTHLIPVNEFEKRIIRNMILFKYFSLYVTQYFERSLKDKTITWIKELHLPDNFDQSDFFKFVKDFCYRHLNNYLVSLKNENHSRRFVPFTFDVLKDVHIKPVKEIDYKNEEPLDIKVNDDVLFTIVNSKPAHRKDGLLKKDKISFDDVFTSLVDKIKEQHIDSKEREFILILFKGISEIYNKRYEN